MTTDYEDLYADAPAQTNHWWWRPGWGVGTRFLAFHITLDRQDELHALADSYDTALRPFASLDLIPPKWRHITLQGLGHVETVPHDVCDQVLAKVAGRLEAVSPITSRFQHAAIFGEAITLPPDNPAEYAQLRNAIRAGITDTRGSVAEQEEGFRAHASVAYSNQEAFAQPIREALDAADPDQAVATFDTVDLIEMHRDERMYEWTTVATLPLG